MSVKKTKLLTGWNFWNQYWSWNTHLPVPSEWTTMSMNSKQPHAKHQYLHWHSVLNCHLSNSYHWISLQIDASDPIHHPFHRQPGRLAVPMTNSTVQEKNKRISKIYCPISFTNLCSGYRWYRGIIGCGKQYWF